MHKCETSPQKWVDTKCKRATIYVKNEMLTCFEWKRKMYIGYTSISCVFHALHVFTYAYYGCF